MASTILNKKIAEALGRVLVGRAGYWLGFAISFSLVALALVIQTQYHLEPCPLCISQRMVFMGIGLVFLAAALQNPATYGRKIYASIQVFIAFGGVGVALRHWYLQAHHGDIIADCGSCKAVSSCLSHQVHLQILKNGQAQQNF